MKDNDKGVKELRAIIQSPGKTKNKKNCEPVVQTLTPLPGARLAAVYSRPRRDHQVSIRRRRLPAAGVRGGVVTDYKYPRARVPTSVSFSPPLFLLSVPVPFFPPVRLSPFLLFCKKKT